MELVRLVLPRMRARGSGRILNVSSVGGMVAMPTMPLYSASKFALEGATEALYYEVKTIRHPGDTDRARFHQFLFFPEHALHESGSTG